MKKAKLVIKLLLFISTIALLFSCKKDQNLTLKERIRSIDLLFENSKVEEVAKDVNSDDYDAVKTFFKQNPNVDVDTKSPYIGGTLLQIASARNKYQAVKALLESGANPNLEELKLSSGESSFTYMLGSRDTTLIKLYINHGADVNKISKLKKTPYRTPLIKACRVDLNSVKFLIKYGANPHAVYNKYESPLNAALQSANIFTVNYLIFDLKVDYKKPYYYDQSIAWSLRDMAYPINSEKHRQKMKLVKFLKENGIDYYAESIPERFHRLFDEDYLSKY
jgi:ankyrin repeat protein